LHHQPCSSLASASKLLPAPPRPPLVPCPLS
jgi:hypothetical protein